MHRSGTSCLTGILQRFDVELGEVFTENPHNKRGNRENAGIMELNNDVLAHNGGAWDKPVKVTLWTEEHVQRRDTIINAIRPAATELFWGFKDPRTLLALPFWLASGVAPRFIGTFRHPACVALSLQARNRMPISESLNLWLEYNTRLIALWELKPFPLVDFDLPSEQYLHSVTDGLLSLLGQEAYDKATYAEGFFSQDLRSRTVVDIEAMDLPADVIALYGQLKECRNQWILNTGREII
jgi:hypothetical protein